MENGVSNTYQSKKIQPDTAQLLFSNAGVWGGDHRKLNSKVERKQANSILQLCEEKSNMEINVEKHKNIL